ncbi:MAG: HD domain-containing protein [Lachnospira sp.]|jgi:HD-GYP domain-containing protein (c-di-GMP phosphodiesterase class II)|nr:HD domain-containing protein [Lachnospira sp.]
MKKVKVKSLKGNEILALPIVTDGGTVLIHADVELKPELINRAIRLGIKSLYIKDYPEEVINKENYNHIVISSEDDYDDVYNEGQDVSDSECADVKNEKKTEYNNKYIENHIYKVEETAINSRTIIKDVLEKHIYRHNSDLKVIGEQAEKIIESVIEEPEVITNITEMRNISTDMYTHCINVCALSTIMALRLKMSEKQVRNISIGAILHDIGLRYIKVPYMNTNETYMNVKDALEYKKHTIFGYSSLQDEGWIPDIAKEIILLHHERIDGKGYPFQHKGDKIKTEVKLVSLCDDFESLISGVGSTKLKIYEAIEYIKANQGIKYDATITDKLLESVAVYPVGINVITSEGEMGVVVRQNHKFTDRPVIKMLKHADGSPYNDDVEKDLMKYLTLFIVDTE